MGRSASRATARASWRTPLRWAAITLLAAPLAVQTTGCSIVGLTAGAIHDARLPPAQLVPAGRVVRLERGDLVTLHLRDSTIVRGMFAGHGREPAEDYARRYRAWRATRKSREALPRLGERLKRESSGIAQPREAIFRGFALGGLEVESHGKTELIEFIDAGRLRTSEGHALEARVLQYLAFTGGLPLVTLIELEDADNARWVPADEVVFLEAPTHKRGAHTGFLIGLAVDAMVVLVATAAMASAGGSGCDTKHGSWPSSYQRSFSAPATLPPHAPPGR